MFILVPITSFFLLILIIKQKWKEPIREVFLKAVVLFGLFTLITTEVLSAFQAFNFFWIRVSWLLGFSSLLIYYIFQSKKVVFFANPIHLLKLPIDEWFFLVSGSILVVINGWVAFQSPPNNWDSMVYHLSRIQHWFSNQSIEFYASHIHRQLFLNPWMEYGLAHLMGLSISDRFFNLFGFFFWLGTGVLISYLACLLGANKRAQLLSGLICLLIPSSILQASTTKNDLALSFWCLAAIIMFFQFQEKINFSNAFFFGASVGLAILTKTTAYVLLAPLVIWYLFKLIKFKNWNLLKLGFIIAGLVIIINGSHIIRNFNIYQNPFGPIEETSLYSNSIFGFRPLLSNMVRNTLIHLRTTEQANDVLFSFANSLHGILNLDISDPRTTWAGYQFDLPPFRVNEDESGSPLHLIFFIICFVIFIAKKTNKLYSKMLPLFFILTTSFIFFSGYLKWQFWQARLMISFFMISSLFIGIVVSKYFARWLQFITIGLFLLLGLICIWKNPTKPLPIVYDYNIVNMPRSLVMIYDNSLKIDYMAGIEYLERDLNCDQIGIILDNADWEYPFWVLLSDNFNKKIRIEHINVYNQSGIFEDLTFTPCAVMDMTVKREESIKIKNGALYKQVFDSEQLSIYSP